MLGSDQKYGGTKAQLTEVPKIRSRRNVAKRRLPLSDDKHADSRVHPIAHMKAHKERVIPISAITRRASNTLVPSS